MSGRKRVLRPSKPKGYELNQAASELRLSNQIESEDAAERMLKALDR
nr:MAG TPA: hypothetical protein [Caudoviricetes sp.]